MTVTYEDKIWCKKHTTETQLLKLEIPAATMFPDQVNGSNLLIGKYCLLCYRDFLDVQLGPLIAKPFTTHPKISHPSHGK